MNRETLIGFVYGIGIWLVGFVWGSVVFMTEPLKALPAIPYVSRYPAISFPLLVGFAMLAWWAARRHAARFGGDSATALRLGVILAGSNLALDVLVLAIALGNGVAFFQMLTIWIAYAILLFAPIVLQRRSAR
jgi:hypothetical protein